MEKKDFLPFCRYYKGEKENPYESGNKALFWDYERAWIDKSVDEKDDTFGDMLDEYIAAGLSEFEMRDGIPATLKALLYNRFCHWQMADAASFKKWYHQSYLNQ